MTTQQGSNLNKQRFRLFPRCILLLAVISLDVTLVLLLCVHTLSEYDRQICPVLPHGAVNGSGQDSGSSRSVGRFLTNASVLGPVVNEYRFSCVLEPDGECGADNLLVIYVHSHVENVARRTVIRRTWGNLSLYSGTELRLFFVVALPRGGGHQRILRAEARRHNDIVQLGFDEHYRNMTYKAIGALQWLTTRCRDVKFYLKTDDDTFVNTFALFRHLRALSESDAYTRGFLLCCRGPLKLVYRTGKWAVSESEYPQDYYPYYCSGMAYVLTVDVARAIFQASARVPYFWIDDVYITGMVPEAIRLGHTDMRAAYVLEVNRTDELFGGREWFKFAFCHMPDLGHFEALWHILKTKASQEEIPVVADISPGRLADNYTYLYKSRLPAYYVPPLH